MKLKCKINNDLVQGFSLHHNSIVNKKSKAENLGNYESGINTICTRPISKGETIYHFFIKLEESNKTRVFSFQMNEF